MDVGGALLGAGGFLTGATGFVTAWRAKGKATTATSEAAAAAATTQEHREQLEAWRGIASALRSQLRVALQNNEKCEQRVQELSDDVSHLRTELIAMNRGWQDYIDTSAARTPPPTPKEGS